MKYVFSWAQVDSKKRPAPAAAKAAPKAPPKKKARRSPSPDDEDDGSDDESDDESEDGGATKSKLGPSQARSSMHACGLTGCGVSMHTAGCIWSGWQMI